MSFQAHCMLLQNSVPWCQMSCHFLPGRYAYHGSHIHSSYVCQFTSPQNSWSPELIWNCGVSKHIHTHHSSDYYIFIDYMDRWTAKWKSVVFSRSTLKCAKNRTVESLFTTSLELNGSLRSSCVQRVISYWWQCSPSLTHWLHVDVKQHKRECCPLWQIILQVPGGSATLPQHHLMGSIKEEGAHPLQHLATHPLKFAEKSLG